MALLKRRGAETEAEPEVTPVDFEKPERPNAKGRPTPKRDQARAARPRSRYALSGPTGAPAGGKAGRGGSGSDKTERRRQSSEYRQAMLSGDISRLPPRERAPERILARDTVDTRRNVGPYFLIAAAIYFVGGLVPNSYVRVAASYLMIAALLAVIVDSVVLARKLNAMIKERYPDSRVRVGLYSAQRALMPRRWRLPRPRVSR